MIQTVLSTTAAAFLHSDIISSNSIYTHCGIQPGLCVSVCDYLVIFVRTPPPPHNKRTLARERRCHRPLPVPPPRRPVIGPASDRQTARRRGPQRPPASTDSCVPFPTVALFVCINVFEPILLLPSPDPSRDSRSSRHRAHFDHSHSYVRLATDSSALTSREMARTHFRLSIYIRLSSESFINLHLEFRSSQQPVRLVYISPALVNTALF